MISYAVLTMLVHFAENRGGCEIFDNILLQWQDMEYTGNPWDAVWKALGYSDYAAFLRISCCPFRCTIPLWIIGNAMDQNNPVPHSLNMGRLNEARNVSKRHCTDPRRQ